MLLPDRKSAAPPDTRRYCAVNVVAPVTVTRYDALPEMVLSGAVPGDRPFPTAKLSEAACVSPPDATKLMKQPESLDELLQFTVSVTSTRCVPVSGPVATTAAVPDDGAA